MTAVLDCFRAAAQILVLVPFAENLQESASGSVTEEKMLVEIVLGQPPSGGSVRSAAIRTVDQKPTCVACLRMTGWRVGHGHRVC